MARLKVRTPEKTVSDFGYGSSRGLSSGQLTSLYNASKFFREHLVDMCLSHALYRCTLTTAGAVVNIVVYGSSLEGNLQELHIAVDTAEEEVYTKGIKFDEGSDVEGALYDLIDKLSDVPFNIGMLDIPFEGEFLEGVVCPYKYEDGAYLIVIKDSLDMGYFLED